MFSNEIATIIGAQKLGADKNPNISHLLTDSRSLTDADGTLFFALRTASGDGHKYIKELYEKGVRAFVVDNVQQQFISACSEAVFLKVEHALSALQALAAYRRAQFDIPIVGITGSNGKTIVKEWLYQLLSPETNVVRSPLSYNSQIGVPLSVWQLNEQAETGIFEAGISAPGEMQTLEAIIRPTLGIITNIGAAHQEFFQSSSEKCLEKLLLFQHCKTLIYCADDEVVSASIEKCGRLSDSLIAWSAEGRDAALRVEVTDVADVATQIAYSYNGVSGAFSLPLSDGASLQNAIHCLAACLYFGISPEVIADRMGRLSALAMRLEVVEGVRGCVLVNDSYCSDLYSLDLALDFMARRFSSSKVARKVAILSDIDHSGLSPMQLCSRIAQLAQQRGVDEIVGVGEGMVASSAAFSNVRFTAFATTGDLLSSQCLQQLSDALVLIKGARRAGFERVAEALSLKMHATRLEVNLQSLAHNLRYYRSLLQPSTKIVCMIKASAYGAGATEVAKTLSDNGANYLAVAVADEGVALRMAGITAPIMVMNPEPAAFSLMFQHRLEPEIYSFELLEAFLRSAQSAGVADFPIHVKFDTGMSRLGFSPEADVAALIDKLGRQSFLKISSVFTHFAGSDDAAFDMFTREQFARFKQATERLQSAFDYRIVRHACNTAGAERFPEMHLDMVRIGLGLYGISPIGTKALQPVATLTTTILQLRDLPAEATVGYSRRGKLARCSRIAALPIGYADGLNRRLGCGRGHCIVNGKCAPYVGNICMDVCMIDVTDIDCRVGDRVEIFGPSLSAEVVASWLDTIPYEVLTNVSERVKRVYYE